MNRTPDTIPRRSGRINTVVFAVLLAALGVPVYLLGARPLPSGPSTVRAIVRMPERA